MRKQHKGFTLVEILIVVAIIGILAAMAYTNFQKAATKSNRSVARGELMNYATIAQSYFTANGTFVVSENAPSSALTKLKTGVNSEFNYYSIAADATATTFTLTATPIGKAQLKDKDCASFTLTHLGVKKSLDSKGNDSTSKCWK